MVLGMRLTYDEIVAALVVKFIAGSTIGYTLPPRIYEIADMNSMLRYLLPDDVKFFGLKSNLTTNKTKSLLKDPFSMYF